MQDTRTRLAFVAVLLVGLLLVISVSLRASKSSLAGPTVNVSGVQTDAVSTFAIGLTSTAQAQPSATYTSTVGAQRTPSAIGTGSGTPGCLGLHFIRDATIPDNTQVNPAQVFTKSWLVQNSGTCPWQSGFQVVLIGGVAMGGSPFQVTQTIGPGTTIQVSIKMAAPTNQTGIAQGTWMMTDTGGTRFGDYLSVVVVVRSAKTPSPPATSPTP